MLPIDFRTNKVQWDKHEREIIENIVTIFEGDQMADCRYRSWDFLKSLYKGEVHFVGSRLGSVSCLHTVGFEAFQTSLILYFEQRAAQEISQFIEFHF